MNTFFWKRVLLFLRRILVTTANSSKPQISEEERQLQRDYDNEFWQKDPKGKDLGVLKRHEIDCLPIYSSSSVSENVWLKKYSWKGTLRFNVSIQDDLFGTPKMRTSAPYYFNLVWHASLKIASKLDTPFSLPPLLNWNILSLISTWWCLLTLMQFLLKINWAKVWGDRENFYKIWVVRNIEGRTLSSPFDVALALIEANFPASLLFQKQQNLVPD